MREDVGMAEDIYGRSASYLQGKKFHHKVQNVEPIIVPNIPKGVLDRFKNFTLWCDLMYINDIVFLNIISLHSLFAMRIMIKDRKVKNIEDLINQVDKLYLQRVFNTNSIHNDSEFEPLHTEMSYLRISLNW